MPRYRLTRTGEVDGEEEVPCTVEGEAPDLDAFKAWVDEEYDRIGDALWGNQHPWYDDPEYEIWDDVKKEWGEVHRYDATGLLHVRLQVEAGNPQQAYRMIQATDPAQWMICDDEVEIKDFDDLGEA